MSASSIARPETPVISEATDDSLIPASSRTFSKRWISRPRSRVTAVRVRVRSRNCLTGDAGDIGGHRRQFDTGIFEDLLQALDLPAAFAGDRGAGARQVP